MSDLVERLRHADEYEPLGHDGWEAADRIEALEAALARIKDLIPNDHTLFAQTARYIARAALAGGGDE